MQPVVVHLQDRRLEMASRVEAIQQGAAAVVLIAAGQERMGSVTSGARVIPGAMIATGALLLWAAFRELRGRVPWHPGFLNLAAGIALLTEWGVSVADGGRTFRASLVMGLLSLGLGAFHHRIQAGRRNRRTLRLDADGLSFRLNPVRRFRVRWADLAAVSVVPDEIILRRHTGRPHRIPLRRLENAREVAEAVLAGSRAAGVESALPHGTLTGA